VFFRSFFVDYFPASGASFLNPCHDDKVALAPFALPGCFPNNVVIIKGHCSTYALNLVLK
jgi:hypothetical protein